MNGNTLWILKKLRQIRINQPIILLIFNMIGKSICYN